MEARMTDLAMLLFGVGSFLLMLGYAQACGKI